MQTASAHRERLVPPWWLLLVLLLIVPAVLLVFLPVDVQAGIAIAIGLYVAIVALLWLGAPVVALEDGVLRAGRARIPVEHLGEPHVLRGDEATTALRSGWVPEEHHVVSPWTKSLVRAAVVDPEDPTPAWLISSRRPEELAAAIDAARRDG